MGTAPRPLILALAAGAALFGCRDIDRFDTEGPAAYCGSIVGTDAFNKGFIQQGAPPNLNFRLEVDTDAPQDKLDLLLKLTERYCVVYQTIRNGPKVSVSMKRV